MALSAVASDVLLNLDIIGSISNHQTLMVEGDRLRFDTRYIQWARRTLTGDSREQIKAAIEKTLLTCEELLHSYQCNTYVVCPETAKIQHEQAMIVTAIADTLSNIVTRKAKVMAGLEIPSTFERYTHDPEFRIQMTRAGDRMARICKWAELLQGIIAKHGIVKLDRTKNRESPEESVAETPALQHGSPSQEL